MFAPLYRGGRVAYVPSARPPVSCFLDPLSFKAGTALNQHWFNFWSGWRRVFINVLILKRAQHFKGSTHVRLDNTSLNSQEEGIHPTRKHFVPKIIYNRS